MKHERNLLRPAKSIAEKMIKVDHTGENGAVNIYRSQRWVSHIRARHLVPQLAEFQNHEEEHRDIFSKHLKSIGVRRCVSYHISGLGGFVLGFVTALIGPKAIAATTYAVENVVLEHLKHQMSYLLEHDEKAYNAVKKIYDDEKEHHDTAHDQMDSESFISSLVVKTVELCTEAVIQFGMR